MIVVAFDDMLHATAHVLQREPGAPIAPATRPPLSIGPSPEMKTKPPTLSAGAYAPVFGAAVGSAILTFPFIQPSGRLPLRARALGGERAYKGL
jgi:hypothetical protein